MNGTCSRSPVSHRESSNARFEPTLIVNVSHFRPCEPGERDLQNKILVQFGEGFNLRQYNHDFRAKPVVSRSPTLLSTYCPSSFRLFLQHQVKTENEPRPYSLLTMLSILDRLRKKRSPFHIAPQYRVPNHEYPTLQSPLDQLPPELLLEIADWLPTSSVAILGLCNRRLFILLGRSSLAVLGASEPS